MLRLLTLKHIVDPKLYVLVVKELVVYTYKVVQPVSSEARSCRRTN